MLDMHEVELLVRAVRNAPVGTDTKLKFLRRYRKKYFDELEPEVREYLHSQIACRLADALP